MDVQADGGNCASPAGGFLRFFNDIPDPRGCNVIHQWTDILVLAFCGVICGADGWVEVETFCNAKLAWFKTFLALPAGIPSHDTFGRVFSVIDPDAFERRFTAWMSTLAAGGKLIAIDGKSIRRSFAACLGQERHGSPGQRVRGGQQDGLCADRGGGQGERDRRHPPNCWNY